MAVAEGAFILAGSVAAMYTWHWMGSYAPDQPASFVGVVEAVALLVA